MPVMNPAVVVVNLTPSSTGDASFESTGVGTEFGVQMLQGQPVVPADVVKLQLTGVITLPLGSAAPLTVAVYCVDGDSAVLGAKVAVCVELLYEVVPLTAVPPEPVSPILTVDAWTGSLK